MINLQSLSNVLFLRTFRYFIVNFEFGLDSQFRNTDDIISFQNRFGSYEIHEKSLEESQAKVSPLLICFMFVHIRNAMTRRGNRDLEQNLWKQQVVNGER